MLKLFSPILDSHSRGVCFLGIGGFSHDEALLDLPKNVPVIGLTKCAMKLLDGLGVTSLVKAFGSQTFGV